MTRHALRRAVAGLALAGVALVLPACSDGPGGGPIVTADFVRGTGLYPGSPVRVLGIDIGRITDVDNVGGHVRVRMELEDGAKVPANARATIVPLTLLGERYIQLGPAWQSGPVLANGAHIPLSRTSVPAEIDELLRSLQDFMGSIDPNRAGDVVTDLAAILEDRGAGVNDLIHNASGTLDILADKGEDLKAIIGSLQDLSSTLKGRTDSIETLIRNYDLVTQVLIDNKGDLDGVITQLDRATVSLASLLTEHEDPLRSDVRVLATTGSTLAANTKNVQDTIRSTVKLFEAAGRAYEGRSNSLRVNNQDAFALTSDIIAGRLRDRIAGLCRRLGIELCSDPASPLLNDVSALLPGLLDRMDEGGSSQPAPPEPPTVPTTAPTLPAPPPLPQLPSQDELLDLIAKQLTDRLDPDQRTLLETIDGERLVALLGVDPVLLQALPKLDEDQVKRLREAKPEDIPDLLLDLYNEVIPPADRLDVPLLPPKPKPGTTTTLPGGLTIPPLLPGG